MIKISQRLSIAEIEQLIKQRKAGYKADINTIISNYNAEKETTKEYNGRQLLELLQNADDAQSQRVLIKLNTNYNTLVISNKGEKCDPFSVEGIKSIMYANLSSKSNGRYIGNKGLGFRSIINWANEISILTNNIKLNFSQRSAEKIYKELVKKQKRKEIQKEKNLSENEIPMAILAIPEIEQDNNDDWTTTVTIKYKENFLDDIKNQIETIKPEVLLFLNHLQSIEIDIDKAKTILKNPVEEWQIKSHRGEVPAEKLEYEDKNSKYELKIAYNNQLTNNDHDYLFAYFPTKIKINLPFIVHGTFELDSSRNQLIDNKKNEFIIKQLVAFIIETALGLKQDEVNYQALNFLQYKHKNEVLEELGFYEEIDKTIKEKEIYPCIDNKYRNKESIVYSNDFTDFIVKNKFSDKIPYLLKFADDRQQVLLGKLELAGFDSINKEDIEEVNKKIEDSKVRADFIHHLIINKYQKELPLLTDKDNQLINFDDDIYKPATQDFSLPDYVQIKFINQQLFDELIEKYDNTHNDWEKFVNLKLHTKKEILQKVITSTNKKLKQENAQIVDLIKSMSKCLYKNYSESDSTTISDQNIPLLDQNQELQKAKDLYLSKTYPSGELTEELFADVFEYSDFLADISVYDLGDDKQKIEDFFLWLGVNKNTRLDKYTGECFDYNNYTEFHIHHPSKAIYKFDIIKSISKEKLILWCLKNQEIQKEINNGKTCRLESVGSQGGRYEKDYLGMSHVHHQLSKFRGYLIENKTINELVNDECVDYSHHLFEKHSINKHDINRLLLKLGAVEKFSDLSFIKIQKVLQSLPEKDPRGKLAQKIYLESFKKHNESNLNSSAITLFAKKEGESRYFPQTEVHYSGSVKLPKEYTDTLVIFDFPRRSVADVVSFFGVIDLSKIQPIISEKKESSNNDKFQAYFKKIKPYILAYRVKDLEDDKDKVEAKKLNNITIKLYQNITCKIDDKEYVLSDYDYLIDDKCYLIKTPDLGLEYIRQEYDFFTVFGDILGLVFGLESTDKFTDCIKDSETNIQRSIKEHISNDAIDDARFLLGIASDFYNFWHKVYELVGKEYTDNHNNNLELISQELELDIEDIKIKYDDLIHLDNAKIIVNIFTKLKVEIEDFNREQTNTIDLSSYHQQKLKDFFDDNDYKFRQNLYQHCIDKSQQKEFLAKLKQYKTPSTSRYAEILEVDYQKKYKEFIQQTFGFEIKEITLVNFDEIFKKNKQKLADDFEYIENDYRIRSLLYFEDKESVQKIKQNITKRKKEQQDSNTTQINTKQIKEIKPAELATPLSNQNSGDLVFSTQSYSQQNKQRKHAGNKAEQVVYDSLVDKYDEENVVWISRDKPHANHDFKYKDENKWWFVEVKILSNDVFYISKNERKFSEEKKGKYKIFLVGDKGIKEIYPVDFNDEKRFILEADIMSVRYKLKLGS